MNEAENAPPPSGALSELLRLSCVTLACAITEVICYSDTVHIYAGIMTGNTVQLGWSLAAGKYAKALPIASAIGFFFIGCIITSFFRNQLKPARRIYWLMVILLAIASIVRLNTSLRLFIELPLLALTMALQGVGISQFSGVKLQTVVVTNNLVKFAHALTARYINPSSNLSEIPSRADVLVPGICWFTFCIGAGCGGVLCVYYTYPLAVPISLLLSLNATDYINTRMK